MCSFSLSFLHSLICSLLWFLSCFSCYHRFLSSFARSSVYLSLYTVLRSFFCPYFKFFKYGLSCSCWMPLAAPQHSSEHSNSGLVVQIDYETVCLSRILTSWNSFSRRCGRDGHLPYLGHLERNKFASFFEFQKCGFLCTLSLSRIYFLYIPAWSPAVWVERLKGCGENFSPVVSQNLKCEYLNPHFGFTGF